MSRYPNSRMIAAGNPYFTTVQNFLGCGSSFSSASLFSFFNAGPASFSATASRWPAPITTRILPSGFRPLSWSIEPARYSSRSSIRTSPAPGATAFNSFSNSVIRSLFCRSSSTEGISSSSFWSPFKRSPLITRNFSRNPIRRHALLIVVWISRSTNSNSIPASSAASMAAKRSVPGFSPSSMPRRRCSVANSD